MDDTKLAFWTLHNLLLLALMRRLQAEGLDKPVSAAEIEDYFLKNRYGKGEQRYKMLLTKTDKDTLIALLDGKPVPDEASHRIVENFAFFTSKIADADLAVVYAGIGKLMIVDVRLQQGIDNPQMIFESMNSTGKALTQADLIRNYVLMGLPREVQTRLYEDHWRPMELLFGAENYNKHFDEFMRFFLVIHTGNHRIRKDDVYNEFKIYARDRDDEPLLAALLAFARYYCCMALGSEKELALATAFQDIRELRADVCNPMLMEVYHDYTHARLGKDEFVSTLQLVEATCSVARSVMYPPTRCARPSPPSAASWTRAAIWKASRPLSCCCLRIGASPAMTSSAGSCRSAMAFSDIDDPRGLCVDVTDLGRWGNGCVEVGLENAADLPYVMGLVRQALELQLGEEDAEAASA